MGRKAALSKTAVYDAINDILTVDFEDGTTYTVKKATKNLKAEILFEVIDNRFNSFDSNKDYNFFVYMRNGRQIYIVKEDRKKPPVMPEEYRYVGYYYPRKVKDTWLSQGHTYSGVPIRWLVPFKFEGHTRAELVRKKESYMVNGQWYTLYI